MLRMPIFFISFISYISLCFVHIFLGSLGIQNDILLEAPESLVSLLEDLRSTLLEPTKLTFIRSSTHAFVCQFKDPEYYLARCFASLYPYGRGCPSDKNCCDLSMGKYIKHVLCLGGGPEARRFQQNCKFIFTVYNMEMKRKIGGAAYLAQRSDGIDCIAEQPPNVKDINDLLNYLEDNVSRADLEILSSIDRSPSSTIPNFSTDSLNRTAEIEKLIKRLVPYSKNLQGSITHITYERSKLMAMIPSPIILNSGTWRLFFTNAPADLYENRFFEVVCSPITDSNPQAWLLRRNNVSYCINIHIFFGIYLIKFSYCRQVRLVRNQECYCFESIQLLWLVYMIKSKTVFGITCYSVKGSRWVLSLIIGEESR